MKNLLSKKAFVAFAAGAMLLSSCHDNDIYDPRDIVKDYADNWQKTFGDIASDQDWNVATSVTANAALNIPGSSTMKIYTANPLSSESRLLAVTNLNNGVGSISFDAIKGSSSVFVAIYQDNKYIIFDNYSVENGQVNIVSGAAKLATHATRVASTWNGVHTCLETDWEDKLKNITLPDGAFQLDQEGNFYFNQYLWPEPGTVYKIPNNATVMYLSKDFNGLFAFEGNIPAGAVLYNYGTVTGFSGNFSGTITIYNLGTMTYNPGSQDHIVYNTGTLYVKDNDACAKILKMYNTGYLEFDGSPAQLHSKSTYYSNGEGISMPYGGVIESACDIHETITVTGNLNIQTGTTKKICGIEATGRVQNTAGRLEVSYINADDIYFEGNNIYLTPGAHLKANTMEYDKAACDVNAAASSNALVEVTKNISFKNDNDFNRTFSDNIYFKIDGSINMNGQTNGGFTDADRKLYNNAADYIAAHGNVNNRLNAGTASGSPECGDAWEIDDTTPPSKTPDEVEKNEKPMSWIIACEDLGSKDDIDFNDVVVSVSHVAGQDYAIVTPLAAGGIYNAEIGFIGKGSFGEIHTWFGQTGSDGEQLMINTGTDSGANIDGLTADPKKITVSTDYSLSYNAADDTNMGGFYIKVSHTGDAKTIIGATVGEAPQMILVPGDWKWPKERVHIEKAYELFKSWSGNGKEYKWYDTISDDNLVYYGGNDNSSTGNSNIVSLNEYIQSGWVSIPASVFEPYVETGATITITTDGYVKVYAWESESAWNAYIDNVEINNDTRQFTISNSNIQKIIGVGKMLITFNNNESHVTEFSIQAAQ
ncbi:MAG: DUF4842 domain-containing protein [Prevotella sp.]|nr:DUF4842 domain-containing protein [Prevotella sp.]